MNSGYDEGTCVAGRHGLSRDDIVSSGSPVGSVIYFLSFVLTG